MNEALRQRLSDLIAKNEIVLFMKGSRHFPQCGFSAQVVGVLNELGAKYETVNVLADPEVREGIKELSSWPTIPQLYVRGTFVGGCDIVREMHANGELRALVGGGGAPASAAPKVAATPAALRAFGEAAGEAAGDVLRLEIDPQFQYDLYFAPARPDDVRVSLEGALTLHLDAQSARRADGMTIDFVADQGGGFKIVNPNEPPRVRSMTAPELKAHLDKGTPLTLVDVRTDQERAIATIPGARPLDPETRARLDGGDKGAMIVLHCHHGVRSRNAAERLLAEGFSNVWNLEGGIEAWSSTVDPSVPRY